MTLIVGLSVTMENQPGCLTFLCDSFAGDCWEGFDAQVKEWRDHLLSTLDSSNEIVSIAYFYLLIPK